MAAHGVTFQKTGSENMAELVETLGSATPRRFKLFEVSWANTATPADNLYSYVVRRVTNTGTGTGVTPRPYDEADGAAIFTAKHLITTDATTFSAGLELYREPLNARASFRWVANPGREFVSAGDTTHGLAFGLGAVSTSTFGGALGVEEQ